MNISKFKVFMKIVELNSLTKASEELGYTQSGVSHIINSLEDELGFFLLTRSRSGVQLTTKCKKQNERERSRMFIPYPISIINSNIIMFEEGLEYY